MLKKRSLTKKNVLLPFTIFLFLFTLSALFYYKVSASIREEMMKTMPKAYKAKSDIQAVMIPNEFIDYVKQSDGNAQGTLSNEAFALKKLGFTMCLRELSTQTNFWKKEGSEAFFMKQSGNSLDGISAAQEAMKAYIKKYPVIKENKNDLVISKCLEFYDSRELKDAITNKEVLP